MPLVTLRRSQRVPDEVVDALVKAIPVAVSESLDCNDLGGDLTPDDIEVEVGTIGPLDRNRYDICVNVIANDYPERKASLEVRRQHLQAALIRHIPGGLTGYVWVRLCPASFGEFVGSSS